MSLAERSVECPFCRARVGEECWTVNGRRARSEHEARVRKGRWAQAYGQKTSAMRFAVITGLQVTPERVAAYLPGNYAVVGTTQERHVVISGIDVAGWTLEDYVLPRLGSGVMVGRELR